MFALSTHPRLVGKYWTETGPVRGRTGFMWMVIFVVIFLCVFLGDSISGVQQQSIRLPELPTTTPRPEVWNQSTVLLTNLSLQQHSLPVSHTSVVNITLAIFLPDPYYCNRTLLERLRDWTDDMVTATEKAILSRTSPIIISLPLFEEKRKHVPIFSITWHPVCEDNVVDREKGKPEGNQRLDLILYEMFKDPTTCIVVSMPKRQRVRRRHVRRNQHWQWMLPDQQYGNTRNKEVFDAWNIDDESITEEDYYHDALAVAPIWQKPYISANGDVVVRDLHPSHMFTLMPTLSQVAHALAIILDHLRWQHVVILTSRDGYWSEFGRKMFVELIIRQFYVKSFIFESDNLLLDTSGSQENITYTDKVFIEVNMKTVFMVAEKPSLAASLAKISNGSMTSKKGSNGAYSVHEYQGKFQGEPAFFKFTSVCGHVMILDFTGKFNNWDKVDP